MISVYNGGAQAIDSFRVALKNNTTIEVSIGDNQVKDLPDEVAYAIIKEYPLAKAIQVTLEEPKSEEELVVEIAQIQEEIKSLSPSFACSCGKVFDKEKGLFLHKLKSKGGEHV